MADPRVITVFVASPDDVNYEPLRLENVIARLNNEYEETAVFKSIRWETQRSRAYKDFQSQIREPAECDVVITIFGAKLGTELPEDFKHKLPGGASYPSGTAYELLTSIEAEEKHEKPAVYVFRKSQPPTVDIGNRENFESAHREWERLQSFFWTWFGTPTGSFKRGDNPFTDVDDFEKKAEAVLRHWATQHIEVPPTCASIAMGHRSVD
jgi:hypothetical protein